MPNIFSYIRLANYINLNKNYFIKLFSKNEQSTSKYFNQLAFNPFGVTDKITTKLQSYGNHVLNLDLSNFYPSLYTHSLAWIDLGKQVAKNDYNNGIGNNLDKLVRAEQYGETHGVPTGNFLTRIIAEYFLCKIDEEFNQAGYTYVRYVDDFKYAFNDEVNKEQFMSLVHDRFNEYNITLNERKTLIEHYPIKNKLNKQQIFTFFENFSSSSVDKWINKIYNYINLCVDEESTGNKGSIKTMFKGSIYPLKNEPMIDDIYTYTDDLTNYNLYKHFLDISLKDSKLTNYFMEFTENLIDLGVNRDSLKLLVKEYFMENSGNIFLKIKRCIDNKYNQEIYQLLLYFLVFEVYANIDDARIFKLIGKKDSSSLLLNMINSENDDFSITLSIAIYLQIIIKKYFKEANYDEYENYMNNLFSKIDELFLKSYYSYRNEKEIEENPINDDESSRMTEKFWFVRYYIYSLTNKYKNFKDSRNKYLNNNETSKKSSEGYKTQLNWSYVKSNTTIDNFYEMMLDEEVELFHYDFIDYV